MQVYVAEYEHKYGNDVRLFDTAEGALAWRTEPSRRLGGSKSFPASRHRPTSRSVRSTPVFMPLA
jgi:hypothetical protein